MEDQRAGAAACIQNCRYYKPMKPGGDSCLGLQVLNGLLEGGTVLVPEARVGMPSHHVAEVLRRTLCSACPYAEDDCDSMESWRNGMQGGPPVEPCGGFLVLGCLIGTGEIDADDIAREVETVRSNRR